MRSFVVFFAFILPWSPLVSAVDKSTAESIHYHYQIISEGKPIGSFSEKRSIKDGYKLQLSRDTNIDVSSAFWSFNLDSIDNLQYTRSESLGYRLQKLDRTLTEYNKTYRIQGERRGDNFYLNTTFVDDLAKAEERAVVDGTVSIAAAAVPYLGLVLSIFSSEDPRGDLMISSADYDATVADIPYMADLLTRQYREFRLLDTQALKVNTYEISLSEGDICLFNSKEVPCNKIKVRSGKEQHNYWISKDFFGPYLVKATGIDADGPYVISLASSIYN